MRSPLFAPYQHDARITRRSPPRDKIPDFAPAAHGMRRRFASATSPTSHDVSRTLGGPRRACVQNARTAHPLAPSTTEPMGKRRIGWDGVLRSLLIHAPHFARRVHAGIAPTAVTDTRTTTMGVENARTARPRALAPSTTGKMTTR
ncbi:hypothetical protein B0H14DRAFT_3863072 [Mycena olivaceomarginata]|nr:hypothetical protein B0H14DRAFT_3863072 [Mycena olivaceomarginata]